MTKYQEENLVSLTKSGVSIYAYKVYAFDFYFSVYTLEYPASASVLVAVFASKKDAEIAVEQHNSRVPKLAQSL